MVEVDAELNPGLLAVSVAYVPAGTLRVYAPLPSVEVVRDPSVTVAPAIGLEPSVTVPESVPLPTVVQPGNWNEPIRVWWFSRSTA
jgi:hypothetical protein